MSRTRGGGKPLAGTFTAGEWTVLLELNSLERNGRMARLEPKVMQVLMVLCEHCGRVVSKERPPFPGAKINSGGLILRHAREKTRHA